MKKFITAGLMLLGTLTILNIHLILKDSDHLPLLHLGEEALGQVELPEVTVTCGAKGVYGRCWKCIAGPGFIDIVFTGLQKDYCKPVR